MTHPKTSQSALLPSKILNRHLDRQAIVYVRQSTLQQLEHNKESTAVQYALVERACLLGWARPRVNVIDEDLGVSGASMAGRPGFQRLVAEVGLGHVGLVLGFEVSRLARSCRDWYQLLEICALSGTLIGDNDGIYDPTGYNDRLLLGLKGTMSEAELHIMRARFEEGRWHKAERGEFGFNLPRGFLRRPSGEIMLDPDERVRETVQLVFDIFERRRSVHGVVRYLYTHGISLPDRGRSGAAKGELTWGAPTRSAVLNLLTNPAYAGAYAYGRRSRPTTAPRPSRSQAADPNAWPVLIKGHWPAYISWETFERNQRQLAANQSKHIGVARGGPSLLAGILVCGRCGYRMATNYRNNGRSLRYACTRLMVNRGEQPCQSFAGETLDAFVAELILAALRPSTIEVALELAEDLELERARQHRQWSLRLEQARYEAERAHRQYDAVEPENRLVARTLEKRWEDALHAEMRLRSEHEQFLVQAPERLSASERAAIEALAADIPAIWQASSTSAADRKEIARLMLDRIVVTLEGDTEHMAVECHWAGGRRTQHRIRRSVRRATQLACHDDLMARMEALLAEGRRPPEIARRLAEEGWRAPHGGPIKEQGVRVWLQRRGHLPDGRHRPSVVVDRHADEYMVAELSVRLGIPEGTIYRWLHKGLVPARKTCAVNHDLWMVKLQDVLDYNRSRQIPRPQTVAKVR
jgi:DNA invertase Pin-like site-specific DNA recombinase